MEQKLRNRCISIQTYFFSELINTEKQKSSYLLGKHQVLDSKRLEPKRWHRKINQNCWAEVPLSSTARTPLPAVFYSWAAPLADGPQQGGSPSPALSPESCQMLFIYQLSLGRMHRHPQAASELQVRQEVLRMEVLWQVPGPVLRVLQGDSQQHPGPLWTLLLWLSTCISLALPELCIRNREIIQHCYKYCP